MRVLFFLCLLGLLIGSVGVCSAQFPYAYNDSGTSAATQTSAIFTTADMVFGLNQYPDYYLTYRHAGTYNTVKIIYATAPNALSLYEVCSFSAGDPVWIHEQHDIDNPYIITNESQFQFMENITYGNFAMGSDVSADTLVPIASFNGTLDMRGHTLSDVEINNPASANQAIFVKTYGAEIHNGTLTNTTVTGTSYVSCIVANAYSNSNIHNLTLTLCNVTASTYYGSLGVARLDNSDMSYMDVSGTLSGSASRNGGIAAVMEWGSTITHSTCNVNISMTDSYNAGIAGWLYHQCSIGYCSAYGDVKGTNFVSGIAAKVYNGSSVYDSYSHADVDGDQYVSSAISFVYTATIDNIYGSGYVNSTTPTKYGLIGINIGGTVTDSYWDINTTGVSTSAAGTGKTTEEMYQKSTFVDWNFDDIWMMYYYPVFRTDIEDVYHVVNVHDESTGNHILPSSMRMYDVYMATEGDINATTYETVFNISWTSDKMVVLASADNYYSRSMIVDATDVTNYMDMYLINTSTTVIYDTIAISQRITDYDYSDIIVRLDKPMVDGTVTVFSSYLDFVGTTATYLIATDQYILYIITPDETISYGWLTPDADGTIDIVLGQFEFNSIEDWISYTYSDTNTSISFNYNSSKAISTANTAISYLNGTEVYNSTMYTDTGSFTYVIPTATESLKINIYIVADDGTEWQYTAYHETELTKINTPFPDVMPEQDRSIIVFFVILIGTIAMSMFRKDMAAVWIFAVYAGAVYNDLCVGNIYTVSLIGIAAFAMLIKFHKDRSRSVN